MRVVSIIAAQNEERLIAACLEHAFEQGMEVYLLDDGSADGTVALAERYLGSGLIGIETLSHNGTFSLRRQLERKEELAAELDADWFVHQDVDEFRVSRRRRTVLDELSEADAGGFNAVDFLEFTFVPTRESPDHDHPEFRSTMRRYYPFLPRPLHRLTAWKRQERVELVPTGGHRVEFPGRRITPSPLAMRHYLCLSRAHAVQKFVRRRYDPAELAAGWHVWRASLTLERLKLPPEKGLRIYLSDERLDGSSPRTRHLLARESSVATDHTEASKPSSSSPPQSGARTRGKAQGEDDAVTGSGSTAQA